MVDNNLCNLVPGTNGEPIITTDEDLYGEPDYVDFSQYEDLTALQITSSFPKEFTFVVMAAINSDEGGTVVLMKSDMAPYIFIDPWDISVKSIDDYYTEPGLGSLDTEWRSFYLYVKDDGVTTTFTFAIINTNSADNFVYTGTLNTRVSTDSTTIDLMGTYYSAFVQAFLFEGQVPISEVTKSTETSTVWCATPLFFYIEPSEGHVLGICSSKLFISV